MPTPHETIVAFGREPVPEEIATQVALRSHAAPALWALDQLTRSEAGHIDPLDILHTGTMAPYLHWREGDIDTWTSATELNLQVGSLVVKLAPGDSTFIKGHFVTLFPANHPVLLQMQDRSTDRRLRLALHLDKSVQQARPIQGAAYQDGANYPFGRGVPDTDVPDATRILHGLFSTLAIALG